MARFEWSNEFVLNIPEVDRQHHGLVDLINELHEAMLARRSSEIMASVLNRLENYTDEHFAHEEELMRSHEYPCLAEHMEKHQVFQEKVGFLVECHQGKKVLPSLKVMEFLCDWLKKHIQVDDRFFAEFLSRESER